MNRGAGRRKIFINNKHREKFLELIDEITSIYGIEIHAYCLMGNHYHLLLRTPLGNLSDGMRHLNSNYTHFFNRSCQSDGSIFRGRYKSIIVSGERYLLRLSRYIHQNPINAGLVSHLEEYTWSSYFSYIDKVSPPQWLKRDMILTAFEQIESENSMTFREFNENINKTEVDAFFDQAKIPPVMGDDEFKEYINNLVSGAELSPEIIDVRYIFQIPKVEQIIKLRGQESP
jgi:putative transposase